MANKELKENKIEKKKYLMNLAFLIFWLVFFFGGGKFTRLTHWKAPVPPAAVDFRYQ